jgi:hypothetical protein
MMRWLIVLLYLGLSWTIAEAQQSSYAPKGISALYGFGGNPSTATLTNPNITGVQIREQWSAIEPTNGVYDWAYFDAKVTEAKANGKKVVLGIGPGVQGDGLPTWGTWATFTCTDDDPDTVGPILWDTTYVAEWKTVQAALAARYSGVYADSDAVLAFRLTGIPSWSSLDWGMCQSLTADKQAWVDAGYTRVKLRDAFLELATAMAANTTKPLLLGTAGMLSEADLSTSASTTTTYAIDPF